MELWIRSQDKSLLRKPEQLGIYEGDKAWFIGESLLIDYGKYKTKERALEVLDEIQNLLMPISEYKQEVDNLVINYKNIDTALYEMPKE